MSRAALASLLVLSLFVLAAGPSPARADPATGAAEPTPDAVRKDLSARDLDVRLAAARAARTIQDSRLVSPLAHLLTDDDRSVREAALAALVAREGAKDRRQAARLIGALLKPLPREPADADVAREAFLVPALHDLAQEATIETLLAVHPEAPIAEIRPRLLAVANVPSPKAVDSLIGFWDRFRNRHGHATACRLALRSATGMDLRGDVDAWRAWWRGARATFDPKAAAEKRRAVEEAQAEKEERHKRAADRHPKGKGKGDQGGGTPPDDQTGDS